MKGDLKYIDDLTKMKLIDHYVEPKSNWEEFNQKFLSFESKNNLIKPASKKYTNIVVKIAIISVLIISVIFLITLIPWKKTSEENTLIKHKKRIDIISPRIISKTTLFSPFFHPRSEIFYIS